jgi:hypothetical protein
MTPIHYCNTFELASRGLPPENQVDTITLLRWFYWANEECR